MNFERILVPVDFSEHSRRALELGRELLAPNGTLTLSYVWAPASFVSPELALLAPGWSGMSMQGYALQEAQRDLDAFAKEARLTERFTTRVEVGRAAESLLRLADELNADLVVMGTHGHTGLDRFLMGSVAQKVVARANCPVLTVKAKDSSGTAAPPRSS